MTGYFDSKIGNSSADFMRRNGLFNVGTHQNISLNEGGIFEVKFPYQPTRAFSTEKDAVKFFENNYITALEDSASRLKNKIQSLQAKQVKLREGLSSGRKNFSQNDILKYENALKESQTKLDAWKLEYDKLLTQKNQAIKEQSLSPLARQSLKNVRISEANARFNGIQSSQLDDIFGISKIGMTTAERSAYQEFWRQELDKLDSAAKVNNQTSAFTSKVYPSSDPKAYAKMLDDFPLSGTGQQQKGLFSSLTSESAAKPSFGGGAQPASGSIAAGGQTISKSKGKFINMFKGKKGSLGTTAVAALVAFTSYKAHSSYERKKIDRLLASANSLNPRKKQAA